LGYEKGDAGHKIEEALIKHFNLIPPTTDTGSGSLG